MIKRKLSDNFYSMTKFLLLYSQIFSQYWIGHCPESKRLFTYTWQILTFFPSNFLFLLLLLVGDEEMLSRPSINIFKAVDIMVSFQSVIIGIFLNIFIRSFSYMQQVSY